MATVDVKIKKANNDFVSIPVNAPNFFGDAEIGQLYQVLFKEQGRKEGYVGNYKVGSTEKEGTIPIPPTGEVLFDSHRDLPNLHNSVVRTITKEGNISGCGNGLECRASGNPEIKVNADGTFSLWDDDLGRFYGYTCNYDAMMEIECAFWNSGSQTLSLKMRSRHNEGGDPENRFGGYGFAVKKNSWNAKREDYHNVHTGMGSGSLPTIGVQQYFKVRFTVKDEGNDVRQIGEVNGNKVFNALDTNPEPYMLDKASFAKRSYYWVRQNTSVLAELRIKSLRIIKV